MLESMLEGYAEFYSAELAGKDKAGHEGGMHSNVKSTALSFRSAIWRTASTALQSMKRMRPLYEKCSRSIATARDISRSRSFWQKRASGRRMGSPLRPNVVYTMLRNRKYIGEYKFGDTIIENGVPRIVSDDMFSAVQNKIAQNKKAPARKKAIDEYLLTTKLFCGECGAMMVGESGSQYDGTHLSVLSLCSYQKGQDMRQKAGAQGLDRKSCHPRGASYSERSGNR